MPHEVLIQKQSVRRLAVKACQEHIHNQKQVNLRKVFLFHALRNILAVSIELAEVIVSAEHIVVVLHASFQMLASMLIGAFLHVLIGLISENCCNLIPFRIMSLHVVIILHQSLNLIDSEDGCINIVVFQPCMLIQVFKDIFRNGSNTFVRMIQFVKVNLMTLAVFRIVQCLRVNLCILDACDGNASHVLNREPKHIAVSDGFLNHVLMDARVKLS